MSGNPLLEGLSTTAGIFTIHTLDANTRVAREMIALLLKSANSEQRESWGFLVLRVVGERRVAHSFVPGPEQAPGPSPHADYDFLLGRYVDAATLTRATMLAARSGVEPHEVLIAQGWLKPQAYYAALANHLGVPFEPRPDPARLQPPSPKANPRDALCTV